MQPNHYTITRQDAEVLKQLVAFVSQDVFDERRHDGGIGKSATFLAIINDARGALEQIGAYDYDHENDGDLPPYTFWWEGPSDLPNNEIEHALASETEGTSGLLFKRVQVNTALPSGYFADLQIAIDEAQRKICTLISIPIDQTELILGPNWYDIGENLEVTIELIVDGIETHPAWVRYFQSQA